MLEDTARHPVLPSPAMLGLGENDAPHFLSDPGKAWEEGGM